MLKIIHKLNEILNMVKGFDAGYTTANRNAMMISFEGKVYKVEITEVAEGDLTVDHLDLLEDK